MPLVLDLLRHGEAAPSGPGSDDGRPLTPRGEAAIRNLARRLGRETGRPDRMFTSPIKRARDTAAILARGLGLAIPIEELAELAHEREPVAVLDALAARGVAGGRVVLVGHQPLMGKLVEFLTGSAPGIKPGELVRVELRDGAGSRRGRVAATIRPG